MMKRTLSLLLALMLVFSLVPQTALAAEGSLFGLITGTAEATNETLNQILAGKSVLPELAAMDIPLESVQELAAPAGSLEDGLLTLESVGPWTPAYYVLDGERIPYQGSVQLEEETDQVSVIYSRDLGSGRIQGVYDYVSGLARETSSQKSLLDSVSTTTILTALSTMDGTFIEDMIDTVNGLSRWDLLFSDITDAELTQIKADYTQILQQMLNRLVAEGDLYMEYLNRKGKPVYEDYLRVYAMMSEYDDQGLYHYYTNSADIHSELGLLSGCLKDLMGKKQADGTYANEDIVNALLREMGYGLLVTAQDLAGVAETMIHVANSLPGCGSYIPATDLSDADAVKVLFGEDRSATPLVTQFRANELNGIIPEESKPLVLQATATHEIVSAQALDPNCVEEGCIAHWYCSLCDGLWLDEALTQPAAREDILLPALGHELVHVEELAPTATENGNIEHWYCSRCETVWQDEALTQLTNHKNVILPATGEVLPDPEAITIVDEQGEALEQILPVDMFASETLQLKAQLLPEGAQGEVSWKSSDSKIASVEEGLVTLKKPGTVTITASVTGTKLKASVKLNVTYLTEAKKLTAKAELPAIGLQSGFHADMLVYGSGEESLDPAVLTFTVSDEAIASVDENGRITAGEKAGTATVTAAITGDPLKRKVSLKVKVIPTQTESLSLLPLASDPANVILLDKDGQITTDPDQAVSAEVFLDAEAVEADSFLFRISARAINSLGLEQALTSKSLKWSSSDSRIAAVKAGDYGTAIVTVKKGTDGACIISAVTTDLAKKDAVLTLHVRDYSPRLESSSLTINTYAKAGVETALLESYGNAVNGFPSLHDYDPKTKTYNEADPSPVFYPEYTDGKLIIRNVASLKNSTNKLLLKVPCANGTVYEYPITVKVSNSLPSVTVKQLDKFNTFCTDSVTRFQITAKDAAVTSAALDFGEEADFQGQYDPQTGILTVSYSDSYQEKDSKPVTKGSLQLFLEGYRIPVEKAITVKTENKVPKLTLSDSASIIHTALEGEHSSVFTILGAENPTITVEAPFAESIVTGSQVKLILTGTKGGTATIRVTQDNWAKEVVLKHKVTVQTKLPTVKLKTTTVKLNTYLGTEAWAETGFQLSKGVTDFAVTGFACDKDYEGFSLTLDPDTGSLTARLTDPEAADQTLRLYPILTHLPTGQQVGQEKALSLKVDIYSGKPAVTVAASGKLDPIVPGSAITYTIKKLTNISGSPTAVRLEGDGAERFDVTLEDQTAVVTLKKGVPQEKGKTYKLQLVFTIGAQEVAAKVSLKVNQSAVKFASAKPLNLYQSNTRLACVLEMTAPEGASIQDITLGSKTSAPFARALGGDEAVTFLEMEDGRVLVSFKVTNPGYLTYGKSYTVYLDITPKGNAENAQPTSLKLTVKTFK